MMNYCCSMQRRTLVLSLFMLLGASCAASDESSSKAAATTPAPEATPAVATTFDAAPTKAAEGAAVASIASVQLVEDCPDAKSKSAPTSAKRERRDSFAAGLVQPCSQSSLQLAFVGQGTQTAKVEIREVRLLTAEGVKQAVLSAREPNLWRDSGYVAWDGVLPAQADTKVSYKLSVPDFAELEAKLGGSSFGRMFVLELDLAIGGKETTLRSPEFERGRKEIIRT